MAPAVHADGRCNLTVASAASDRVIAVCVQLAGVPAEQAEELLLVVEVVHHKVCRLRA